SRQLPGALGLKPHALAAEELEVVAPRGRPVDVALEIVADRGRTARVDRGAVFGEVVVVGFVEAVALVRERAERHVHERVDGEARAPDGSILPARPRPFPRSGGESSTRPTASRSTSTRS